MNEWIMYLYSALLYTQSAWQSCGGSLLNHHLCAASTWMMRRLPQDNSAGALTSYKWRGERVIEPIKWMGIIRRPWLTRASGGNLARTPGYTPTLYEKCHGIFNDHRESGPQFNIHYTGALGPTQTPEWAPPAGLTNTSSNSNLVCPRRSPIQVLTRLNPA